MKSKREFQTILGSNIRKVRVEKNWTIEYLALEAGLSYSQIGRLELGKRNPTAYTVYVISKTLQTTPADLFESSD